MKEIFSLFAVSLTIIGYVPYIRSILRQETKPHIFSWLVWSTTAFIFFGLQITHGAGAGAFVPFVAGLCAITVLILSFSARGKRDISTADIAFLGLSFLALALWIFAKQPLLSSLLIMSVDLIGFLPTVRKTWYKPASENQSFYKINIIRFACAFLALREYTIITAMFSVVWFFGNLFFLF